MSKRIYSTQKWKAHLKRRQNAEMEKARSRKRLGKKVSYQGLPRQRRKFVSLAVPEVFSLIKNPDEIIAFIATLKAYAARFHIDLKLDSVKVISSDAIALLIATIEHISQMGAIIQGSEPNDPISRDILLQSGFFCHVRSIKRVLAHPHGLIVQKCSKKVEPSLARDLIQLGTGAAYGQAQRSHAAYRALIEAMGNTHNHAAKPGELCTGAHSGFSTPRWFSLVVQLFVFVF